MLVPISLNGKQLWYQLDTGTDVLIPYGSALQKGWSPHGDAVRIPNVRFAGIVDSVGFGVTPDPDVIGKLEKGLPDVQRTLNWVHLAARYPVRVRVENYSPDLFRVGESAVVTVRGN